MSANGTANAATTAGATGAGSATTSSGSSSSGATSGQPSSEATSAGTTTASGATTSLTNAATGGVAGLGNTTTTVDTTASVSNTTGAGGTSSATDPCTGADLLCETFDAVEAGAIPSDWSYNWGANSESVSVQTSQSLSGTSALRVINDAPNSGANQVVVDASGFGATHFGRVYYRVEQVGTMQDGGVAHSTFVSFSDGSSEFRVVDTVMNEQQNHQFIYNIQPAGDSEWGCGSAYDYSYSSDWQCVEWFFSSSTQSYRFFHEGNELETIAVQNGSTNECGTPNREIPTNLGQLNLGVYTYQAMSQGFVVWFDDLAIGSERVGCY